MVSDAPNKALALAKLIGAIAVAGALLAGFMLPYVGGLGLAARNGAELVDELPADFKEEAAPTLTRLLAADGTVITNIYEEYRVPVGTLDEISKFMQQAIVAIEDSRFYDHHGIDTTGTLRAVFENVAAGGIAQGGSTLTQQLVKNTLLYQAQTDEERQEAIEANLGRKLREAKMALDVEKKYTKKEILLKYLNLMNFGAGSYGVAAAANVYFGVAPKDLTLPQAAMIAGIVQNPSKFNPYNNPEETKTRRDLVLDRMAKQGMISKKDAQEAKKIAIAAMVLPDPNTRKPPKNCDDAVNYSGFFCDYVLTYLAQLGITKDQLNKGGLTIKTTIDPASQVAATQAIIGQDQYTMGDPKAAIMDVVEPGTGKVRVMAVNRVWGSDPNDPTQTNVNLPYVASAGAGSTYKVFTAAAALEQKKSIFYTLNAAAPYTSKVNPNYTVSNAGDYPAVMAMDAALYESSNTYFVALEDEMGGPNQAVDMAVRMGLWPSADDPVPAGVIEEQRMSFTLGPDATSPLRLAIAYATLAANGTKCEPVPLEDVLGADGKPLVNPDNQQVYFNTGSTACTPNSIPEGVATTLNQVLIKDITQGTGRRADLGDGRQIAGKTGTAQGNKSYAFVGYTPKLVGAVLAYKPAGGEEPLPPPAGGGEGFGGGYPAIIWRDAMSVIMQAVEPTNFPPADPTYENGETFALPVDCTGKTPDECKAALSSVGMTGVQAAEPIDSAVPAGRVAEQSPPAGSRVVKGQAVYFTLSNGSGSGGLQPCGPGQLPTPEKPCIPGGGPPGGGGGGGGGGGDD